ncbi:hypothetical protein RMSM_00446 [Rhodopirellula maiorica SM1]|uniref:Uncharacterized protein n=1 Tax=Rhodopirellula maiorica SM1 TaxID=1265738 RepID=M5S8Y1_9BACT|nr:hypothetical protein RMSM_00446 [Rhodopirellula maiorica SM1]
MVIASPQRKKLQRFPEFVLKLAGRPNIGGEHSQSVEKRISRASIRMS